MVVSLLSLAVTHSSLLSHVVTSCITCCHSLSLVAPLVVIRCYLLSYVVTRCTTCCHSLYHSLSLLVIRFHFMYHSLSQIVITSHSLYHSLPFVVTRCTTLLSFYKRSTETVKRSCFQSFRYTGSTVFSYK